MNWELNKISHCWQNLISCKRSKLSVVKNHGLKPPPCKWMVFHYFWKWWITKITNLVSGENPLPQSWNGEIDWGSYVALDSSPVEKLHPLHKWECCFFFHRAWVSAKRSSGGLGVPVFYQILLVTWKLQGMFYCITDFTESLQVFCKLVYIPAGRFSLPICYK